MKHIKAGVEAIDNALRDARKDLKLATTEKTKADISDHIINLQKAKKSLEKYKTPVYLDTIKNKYVVKSIVDLKEFPKTDEGKLEAFQYLYNNSICVQRF